MFRGFKRGAGPKGSRVVWKGCGKRFGGLTGLWPEGCGLPCRAMNEYICRLSAALKTEQPGCARWKCTTFSAAHHLFPPGGGTLLSTYLPARHVILSRRRRIPVRADNETFAYKYRWAGRKPQKITELPARPLCGPISPIIQTAGTNCNRHGFSLFFI